MEGYQYWIIIAVILTLCEIFTPGFAIICFAIGALFAALASFLGASLNIQIIFMILFSGISFVLVRPFMLRFFSSKKGDLKTNADALVGRIGIVSEEIDAKKNTGRVMLDGDDWKAVSESDTTINKGDKVEIIDRNSIILIVKKI